MSTTIFFSRSELATRSELAHWREEGGGESRPGGWISLPSSHDETRVAGADDLFALSNVAIEAPNIGKEHPRLTRNIRA